MPPTTTASTPDFKSNTPAAPGSARGGVFFAPPLREKRTRTAEGSQTLETVQTPGFEILRLRLRMTRRRGRRGRTPRRPGGKEKETSEPIPGESVCLYEFAGDSFYPAPFLPGGTRAHSRKIVLSSLQGRHGFGHAVSCFISSYSGINPIRSYSMWMLWRRLPLLLSGAPT